MNIVLITDGMDYADCTDRKDATRQVLILPKLDIGSETELELYKWLDFDVLILPKLDIGSETIMKTVLINNLENVLILPKLDIGSEMMTI